MGWDDLVYAPPDRLGVTGESSFVQGRQGQGPSAPVSERESRSPGVEPASRVPYGQVFSRYRDAAGDAIERGAVPPALRDYVRQYFAQLEPQ
jgi:hypothetical protein